MKPDNFLVGRGDKSALVYVIDFGLAKRYRDPKTSLHIPYKNNKRLTGTARYASINTHLGIEQSRRDDLEGICYVVTYFLRGNLPWQGMTARNKNDKYRKIMDTKIGTSLDVLCKGLPGRSVVGNWLVDEFQTMLKYCRSLKFEEDPNYIYLKGLLKDVFTRSGFQYDFEFDWNTRMPLERKLQSSERLQRFPPPQFPLSPRVPEVKLPDGEEMYPHEILMLLERRCIPGWRVRCPKTRWPSTSPLLPRTGTDFRRGFQSSQEYRRRTRRGNVLIARESDRKQEEQQEGERKKVAVVNNKCCCVVF